jgi:hypothetical protein
MHAIGRSAVHVQEAQVRFAHHEWTIQSQRIAGAAAVALGRHDDHLGDRGQGLGQHGQTRREVAVIVAEENAHSDSGLSRAPRGAQVGATELRGGRLEVNPRSPPHAPGGAVSHGYFSQFTDQQKDTFRSSF